MLNASQERRLLWISVAMLALYLSPLYLLGEEAHIRVHDNLDSNIAWYKVLVNSGEWFGSYRSVIPQVMNGLARNAYGTEFSGNVLLHAFFPSMGAYALSQTVSRVFAFLGMYLLLKDHFIPGSNHSFIRVGVALAFALTPFWPSGMLSTLGQPLALWAILHIRQGKSEKKHWFTIISLPFYSSFVLGFFFFLTAVGLLWLWDLVVNKRWNLRFLGSVALMGAMYLAVEYRLLLSLVLSDEPTSRDEFVSSRLDLRRCLRLAIKNFVFGHNHVMTLHTIVILPVTLIVLYLILTRSEWKRTRIGSILTFLTGLNLALSVWYAFWFHKGWQPLKQQFSLLNTFNFARFHFLRPLIIYLGFALACRLLVFIGGKKGLRFAKAAIIAQVAVLFANNEEIVYRNMDKPSFREFYAVEQFREIERFIGLPKETYRVASIGLHPAIAQYNGFYTLDSYANYYSLQYKHAFRRIIEKELDKKKKLRTYFDTWGGRCYLFVAELGRKYDYRKTSRKKIRNLELNVGAFKGLGGRFIFSAVPILNAEENGLTLRGVYVHPRSVWKVHVYEVGQ
ncbi:DUF6044 family protein [Cohnella luojiensis]|uniref:YkoS n=1 Tax=Cohnella luojiensis TaxID=652876 RepID=A0A4Y8M286_9BACL|nr:DUF6044 family protein [Cohnella luojiensis]TFE28159.1 hypothetical protein E2980_08050 [Cohnella luojiensis]